MTWFFADLTPQITHTLAPDRSLHGV